MKQERVDHTATDILYRMDATDRDTCTVALLRGDSAWQPGSTSRKIWGPATVTYIRFEDGAVEARVS